VLGSKIRVTLLGLMALLLVGSYAAASAYAEGGPYFHHREIGGKGEGEKVEEKSPEQVQGTGGEQTLEGTIGTTASTINAKEVQIKGIVYNNPSQGQYKFRLIYHEPILSKPATLTANCKVKIGTENTVFVNGHQMWKWNGTLSQLTENPQLHQTRDGIIVPLSQELKLTEAEEELNEIALPKEEFTSIHIEKGEKECLLAGVYKVSGGVGVVPVSPPGLEEWSQKEKGFIPPYQVKQHFWQPRKRVWTGIDVSLTFANNPATLSGGYEIKDPTQELALFEK
jgi:hypothetical protein